MNKKQNLSKLNRWTLAGAKLATGGSPLHALLIRAAVLCLASFVLPAAALTSEIPLSTSDGKTLVSPSGNVSNSPHSGWTASSDNTKVATVEMKTGSSTSTQKPEIYVTPVAKGTCTVTVKYPSSGSTWTLNVTVTEPVVPREIEYDGVKITVLGATDTLVGEDLVLTFTESGSLTLPQTFADSRILVVGGGGSGACGASNGYYGGSGAGGDGKLKEEFELPAGTYTISVGRGGESVPQKTTTGKSGGDSSFAGEGSFETILGAGGAAGTGSTSNPGANGNGCKITTDITGSSVTYGTGGAKATKASTPVDGKNPGDGGQGNYYKYSSGAGANGIVIVRLKPQKVRTPIAVPTAATAFTFDNTPKTCVAAGTGYVRGGTYEAKNAGSYTATVTPDDDHCWQGGSRTPVEIKWTIARRPATVTVVSTNKVEGATFTDPDQRVYNDPIWTTTAEGLIASDTTELTWDIFRTNACEEVGTYDLLVEGEKEQGNYELTFVGGKYEICEAPPPGPTISGDEGELEYDPDAGVVVVTPNENVTEIEIVNMPADVTAKVPVTVNAVKGVAADKIAVTYTAPEAAGAQTQTYDITKAFTIAGDAMTGVTIALDPNASVTIGEGAAAETITVEPKLTESGDKTIEPFEVADGEVDVGVKTIPGLTYSLKRSVTVETVSQGNVVDSKRAETTRTKLNDPFAGGKPPKAFYRVEVGK